jgi:hypothetical protein
MYGSNCPSAERVLHEMPLLDLYAGPEDSISSPTSGDSPVCRRLAARVTDGNRF